MLLQYCLCETDADAALYSLLLGLLPDCGPIAGEMGGDKQRKSLTAVSIIAAAQHVS
jgi:hypothetical protein